MLSFCAWVFARLHVRSERRWPDQADPGWSAAAGLMAVLSVNAISGLLIASWMLGLGIQWAKMKAPLVLFDGSVLLVIYLTFIRGRCADVAIRRIEAETDEERRRGTMLLWLYIVGSILALILIAWFTIKPHR